MTEEEKRKQWYVVHVLSGQEKKVHDNLVKRVKTEEVGDYVYEILLPTERVSEVKRGKKTETTRKFYPGYILINMWLIDENKQLVDKTWYFIKETTGVLGFAGTKDRPIPMMQKEVDAMLAQVRASEEKARPSHPAVIPLQPRGSRTPLYWVDGSPIFLPLARSFDENQPVLGLRVPISEAGRFQVPFRIEDGAGELVRYLLEVQPAGPYYLAGLCINGLVAYEMARQLESAGSEVAMLGLFDVPCPSTTQVPLADPGGKVQPTKMAMLWTELLQGGIAGVGGFVDRRWKAIARRLKLLRWKVQQSVGLKVNLNKLLNDPDAVEEPGSYFSKPRRYAGRVTFFQSDDWNLSNEAWDTLISGGWEAHRVSGGHLSMFDEENAVSLADKLQACLSDCQMKKAVK